MVTTVQNTWYLYMLYSVRTGKLYTGVSKDPQDRLRRHNNGKGAKATKTGGPWQIVYVEPYRNRTKAVRREYEVRCLARTEKLVLAGLAA